MFLFMYLLSPKEYKRVQKHCDFLGTYWRLLRRRHNKQNFECPTSCLLVFNSARYGLKSGCRSTKCSKNASKEQKKNLNNLKRNQAITGKIVF